MIRTAPSALTLLALAVALALPGAPNAGAIEPLEPLPAGAGRSDPSSFEDPPILRTSREPVRVAPTGSARPPTVDVPQGPSPAKDPREARDLGAGWLVKHQGGDGGWGAGGMGVAGGGTSDVATTSIVLLALARDGAGVTKHRAAIERGVDYVVRVVQASPAEGARLNAPQGTQPQYKLGQLVDTHMAALMLGELTGKLDGDRDARVRDALAKVIKKVQAAQQANGAFDSNGWAPVLSSSIAQRSLYRAKELGKDVDDAVLAKGDAYNTSLVDRTTGRVDASAGAGVELYAVAGAVQNTRLAEGRGYAPAAEASVQARGRVARDTDRLIAGFGSIGGEEMLGYMMISDSLAATGGAEWEQWDTKIGAYLRNIQNVDGSWSGHHCITSTVFVTAAAVMTLGAENVPVAKPGGRKG
jgi:hypothetical protein